MADFLDRFEARVNRWFESKIYEAKKDVHEMASFLKPKRRNTLILAVRSRCYDERRDLGYSIGKYADRVRPLRNASFILADADDVRLPCVIKYWRPRPVCVPGFANKRICATSELSDLFHIAQVGADIAQEYSKGESTRVGVVDTGCDESHDELRGKIADAYNGIDDAPGCHDGAGHGTHVAGLIAGETVGIAPGTSLYIAKALDDNGIGDETSVAMALDWAINKQPDAINMSLGSPAPSPLEEELVSAALGQGIALFAAAGNDGKGKSYPAAYDGVTSVAAVDMGNNHAYFSNVDESVDISAPGVDVTSCVPGGYASLSGTSMASPICCGCALLGISMGVSNIENAIKASAQKLGPQDEYGAGRVRADYLLQSVNQYKSIRTRFRKAKIW